MERSALYFDKKENRYLIQKSTSDCFVFDLNEVKENAKIVMFTGFNADLLLLNLNKDIELEIEVQSESSLRVAILGENPLNSLKITANVGEMSHLSYYFADFIPGKVNANVTVNLNGQNASVNCHLASLSRDNDNKEFDVSVFHNSINTYSHMDNYGVCRDNGKLVFSGICKIEKGKHGSKAHQNAKIMVFDEASNGIAKPILKIDENDIEASHAAIVGKINDEHIFYLTSRGLTEEEAKRLITFGYLKPIMNGFADQELKDYIEQKIEGKM